MKRFRFRLQRVLDIREKKEEIALQKLKAKICQIQEVAERISSVENEKVKWLDYSAQNKGKAVDVSALKRRFEYCSVLTLERQNLEKLLAKLKQEKNALRDELLQRKREKEILIRLKQRHRKQYNYRLSQEQIKDFDELNINKYVGRYMES